MNRRLTCIARGISIRYRSSPEGFAALLAGLVSLGVYLYTLAPTVTLELSGSLVTAADYMGVANSPGYPSWTLAAWFFQWLLGGARHMGHPNPAWGVAVLSACAMSGASAAVAWLTACACRLGCGERRGGQLSVADVSWVSGTVAGLLLAFSRTVWSQSVIAETHALNALVFSLLLVFLFKWHLNRDARHLMVAAFLAGLSITTSYTNILLLPVLVVFVGLHGWQSREMAGLACFALGLAFVLYMPVASSQNPPINWGDAQTMEGFRHMLARGQYERVRPLNIFAYPVEYGLMLRDYVEELARQFTGPVAAIGVVSIASMFTGERRIQRWTGFIILAWLVMGAGLVAVVNSSADVQTRFIARVYFIPSYLCYALLVGRGMGLLLERLTRRPERGMVTSVTPA